MQNDLLSDQLKRHRKRHLDETQDCILVSKGQTVELWKQAMDGNEASWHLLWMQGHRMVRKLVKKFIQLGKILPGDEMDALSVGYLAIGESLPSWTPNRGAYSTYIWTCIRNALVDFNMDESKGGLTGEDAESVTQTALEGYSGSDNHGEAGYLITDFFDETHYLDVDIVALFMDYQATLTGSQRDVLDLLFWGDKTQAEIGLIHGISQATVHRLVETGIAAMKAAYNKTV